MGGAGSGTVPPYFRGPFADLDAAAIALETANGIPFWKQRLRLKSVASVVEKYNMKASEVYRPSRIP